MTRTTQDSKATKVLQALKSGEKSRADLLEITGGATQGLQGVLQRLVAEKVIVRTRPGVYRLPASK